MRKIYRCIDDVGNAYLKRQSGRRKRISLQIHKGGEHPQTMSRFEATPKKGTAKKLVFCKLFQSINKKDPCKCCELESKITCYLIFN